MAAPVQPQAAIDPRLTILLEQYAPKYQVVERENVNSYLGHNAILISAAALAIFGSPLFSAIGLGVFVIASIAVWIKSASSSPAETMQLAGDKQAHEALMTPGFFQYGLQDPARLSSAERIGSALFGFRNLHQPIA